ncbi:hypothetical protein [Mammaliicoccus sciuri]|uniref:hypothetical protein n=1 Tax=Mammaliicoccus sciuri TaxID=1296 RepID=UPI001E48BF0D|nr:hypothetical protein [Mammaliicoccus sciuri]MCD8799112.1 hypothetical protein [Mammaliicoccus sciuri]
MTSLNLKPPIVDTDIWVYLVLSGLENRVINYYGYLQFSDVVEKEILRWKKNEGESKNIALNFIDNKKSKKLRVIDFDEFETIEKLSINHQLNEYGLKEVNVVEKNKGEFASLLYALHKRITKFKTNDRNFKKEIGTEIQNEIMIINWEDVLEEFSKTTREKYELQQLLNKKEKIMKQQKIAYKRIKQDPRWEKLLMLVH